ncbi:hypothetical protein [Actinophytocola sp.]|uniref:hypothetical protein n=1 Tax=Actinophytocola sp. TaxID=1872138 RepID=UPI0038998F1C
MLAWAALSGIIMLSGSAATLVAGEAPVVGFAQVLLAALMVLLWGGATVAGVVALCRQCRRGIGLAVWLTDHRVAAASPAAGALFKATGAPEQAARTALATMGGPALLAARVTQLETGRRPVSRTSMRSAVVLTSLPGLALIVGYGLLMLEVCMALRSCCG